MRKKLGLALSSAMAITALAFGTPTTAAPPTTEAPSDTTAPPTTEVPPTTENVPAPTTTTTTTSSTTTTTTTTLPGVIDGRVPAEPALAPPVRGTSFQLFPPPTTTTTLPPPPPSTNLPANSGSGRRAVYSKSMQRVWVVESNGAVVKNYLVSGKQNWCDPTPGEYRVYSRSRYTFALQNPSIIWGYMVRFAKGCRGGNIGFHEIPTDKRTGRKVQSVSQLGTPLSGGCVRQAEWDAIWMWNWAYVGTKVVVLP